MDRNKLGIAAYRNQYPTQADLTTFMTKFWSSAVDTTFTIVQINGGSYDPKRPRTEANIDIQYTEAIAYPTPHIFYSIGGQVQLSPDSNKPAPGDPFLEWFKYALDQQKILQTITTFVGIEGSPAGICNAVCNLYLQLGARGVGVIFASGDHDVDRGDCKAKDGSGKIQFSPVFPAPCTCVIHLTLEAVQYTNAGTSRSLSPRFHRSLGH